MIWAWLNIYANHGNRHLNLTGIRAWVAPAREQAGAVERETERHRVREGGQVKQRLVGRKFMWPAAIVGVAFLKLTVRSDVRRQAAPTGDRHCVCSTSLSIQTSVVPCYTLLKGTLDLARCLRQKLYVSLQDIYLILINRGV